MERGGQIRKKGEQVRKDSRRKERRGEESRREEKISEERRREERRIREESREENGDCHGEFWCGRRKSEIGRPSQQTPLAALNRLKGLTWSHQHSAKLGSWKLSEYSHSSNARLQT